MTNCETPPSSPAPNISETSETSQAVRSEIGVYHVPRRDERTISADDLSNGHPRYRHSDSSSPPSPIPQVLNNKQRNTNGISETFAVRNEKMNGEMDDEIEEIKHQLDAISKQMLSMDSQLDSMDDQLDGMDRRLISIDKQLNGVNKQVGLL